MRKLKKENKDDFYQELCEKYFNNIYSYCNRLTQGQSELGDIVEECTQETFLEAYKQIEKLQNHPNIYGWLYVTARNLTNNRYRSMYIKRKHEIILIDDLQIVSNGEDELTACLEASYEIDELKEKVLKTLNNSEYELYHDYFINSKPISNLAEKYHISNTAVTTRIYRVKRKIINKVKEYVDNI
ncbi:RNA polymerase sigma factor [Paenibacillus sonchi]|uniref:RNA polymerase sigma factor n=1 Tax=Paenibacillus sonchi TaxID=373687 RepID=UPI001E413D5C|nr:sigma-70 family RNA polymerase sigma factor [Paenibacillus sonchi]MCE3202450.1 sigma-70 family RNA polymerase sigma factor [Paenibacillus sonchi]